MRAALEPGDFRDRLTREVYTTDDPADRVGILEHTLRKVVANEEADRKLERAIRKGEVKRYHDRDWIAEAEAKGVLTAEEARALAEQRDLVARVIAVDDFDPSEIVRLDRGEAQGEGAAKAPPSSPRSEPPEHIAAE